MNLELQKKESGRGNIATFAFNAQIVKLTQNMGRPTHSFSPDYIKELYKGGYKLFRAQQFLNCLPVGMCFAVRSPFSVSRFFLCRFLFKSFVLNFFRFAHVPVLSFHFINLPWTILCIFISKAATGFSSFHASSTCG